MNKFIFRRVNVNITREETWFWCIKIETEIRPGQNRQYPADHIQTSQRVSRKISSLLENISKFSFWNILSEREVNYADQNLNNFKHQNFKLQSSPLITDRSYHRSQTPTQSWRQILNKSILIFNFNWEKLKVLI